MRSFVGAPHRQIPARSGHFLTAKHTAVLFGMLGAQMVDERNG